MTGRDVNLSLAVYPRWGVAKAMAMAIHEHHQGNLMEPALGRIKLDHIQICPQNIDHLTEEKIENLRTEYSQHAFRLHANAHVDEKFLISDFADLDRDEIHTAYWQRLAKVGRRLEQQAYSAHPGKRTSKPLSWLFDQVRRAEDMMGCKVAVEGMYPCVGRPYYLSTWDEYAALLEVDIHYAIDLSHLNILATQDGWRESLVCALLSNPRCIEIHVSGNDGHGDQHQVLMSEPVWLPMLDYANAGCVIFTEGMRLRADILKGIQ